MRVAPSCWFGLGVFVCIFGHILSICLTGLLFFWVKMVMRTKLGRSWRKNSIKTTGDLESKAEVTRITPTSLPPWLRPPPTHLSTGSTPLPKGRWRRSRKSPKGHHDIIKLMKPTSYLFHPSKVRPPFFSMFITTFCHRRCRLLLNHSAGHGGDKIYFWS